MKLVKGKLKGIRNMNELIEALKRVNSKIDYENETGLITNKIIDSIDMTSILAELEETFDIEIDMEYLVPENFDSVQAMWDMIQELKD